MGCHVCVAAKNEKRKNSNDNGWGYDYVSGEKSPFVVQPRCVNAADYIFNMDRDSEGRQNRWEELACVKNNITQFMITLPVVNLVK